MKVRTDEESSCGPLSRKQAGPFAGRECPTAHLSGHLLFFSQVQKLRADHIHALQRARAVGPHARPAHVLRPNRLLGSAGQFLREAEGEDEPGIEKKRYPGDAYV